jgi:hypothetical protein
MEEDLMIQELERIVLTTHLPDHGLQAGDVGTVVLVHQQNKGYEVEFVRLDGETFTVVLDLAPIAISRPRINCGLIAEVH